jgi:hypothetical protein
MAIVMSTLERRIPVDLYVDSGYSKAEKIDTASISHNGVAHGCAVDLSNVVRVGSKHDGTIRHLVS